MAYGSVKVDQIVTSTKTVAVDNLLDGTAGSITSGMIADGTIVDADIDTSAAIADTKLATISAAGKVSLSALDIDAAADIGAALADSDLFIVDDGATGANRKADATRITDYVFGKVAGDITISSNGTADIGSGVIVDADISASAAIADSKLATISTAGKVSGTAVTSGAISTSGSIATTSTLAVGQASAAAYTDLDVNGAYAGNVVTVSALDIDCSAGNYFTKVLSSSSTFSFSNVPSGRAYSFTLEVDHNGGTISWPASVKWNEDTAPTLTTGRTHVFIFVTDNGGTRWRGVAAVDFVD